jgi:hypothetical protein
LAPGTAASAAAFAVDAAEPLNSVSPGPWLIVAGLPAPAGGPDGPFAANTGAA